MAAVAAGTYRLDLFDVPGGRTLATMWLPEGFLEDYLHAGIVVHRRLGG